MKRITVPFFAFWNVYSSLDSEEFIGRKNVSDGMYGKGGDDKMWGCEGNDYIDGGWGFDLLVGDTGDDSLYGHVILLMEVRGMTIWMGDGKMIFWMIDSDNTGAFPLPCSGNFI